MRFGKKLALQVIDDQSGAPYLSHKPMKEAINRTVRELRLYQARVQSADQSWQEGGGGAWAGSSAPSSAAPGASSEQPASTAELYELEARISSLDQQLFALVDEDLARIHKHVRYSEAMLQTHIADLQGRLISAGLLIDEPHLKRLEAVVMSKPDDKTFLCRQLIELRMRSDPASSVRDQMELAHEYNTLVEVASSHAQYLEINVAGFRKLLKRHEKQIPQRFRSRPDPCLGFHRLVTHTSRMMLDLIRQIGNVLADARQRFQQAVPPEEAAAALRTAGRWPELSELKGLGPECEMVITIKRQLKDHGAQLIQAVSQSSGPCSGFLYPKPGANAPPIMQMSTTDKMDMYLSQ
mmetsp:Transcript_44735/g.130216  ORF Transcript_44735/g.130216 Transcript_44735/m.130216 type:complete len:352 (-) Transcript_44735:76-1131(-)